MSNSLKKQNKQLKNELDNQIKINAGLVTRANLFQQITTSHNGKRDLYKIYGYETTPNIDDYIGRYNRQDIAKRIVEAYPKECWKLLPEVSDDNDNVEDTEFEYEVINLLSDSRLKLLHYIKRLDILTGLGQFGALFVGVKDGRDPSQELVGNLNIDDILFLAPYSEKNISITEYEENPQSEIVTGKQRPKLSESC